MTADGDFYDALLADGGEDAQAFLSTLSALREAAGDMSVHAACCGIFTTRWICWAFSARWTSGTRRGGRI